MTDTSRLPEATMTRLPMTGGIRDAVNRATDASIALFERLAVSEHTDSAAARIRKINDGKDQKNKRKYISHSVNLQNMIHAGSRCAGRADVDMLYSVFAVYNYTA